MIEASCHCGAVRFTVPTVPERVTSCNCSICKRLGTLWAYYTTDQVTLTAAADATTAYVWGDRMLALHHCRTCGCTTHWVGMEGPRMGVNARLMDIDLSAVPIRYLDGADTWTYRDA